MSEPQDSQLDQDELEVVTEEMQKDVDIAEIQEQPLAIS